MPKSKRAKVVHLSKVTKKGKELNRKTYANVQECINQYPYLYVCSVNNMRNTYLKDVRVQLSDSRLFYGKTKVMAAALGTTPATSHAPSTYLLGPSLRGDVGLIFSHRPPLDIKTYFAQFHPLDYARAGAIATREFTLPSGTVYSRGGEVPTDEDMPLPHSMETGLRKLGVPSRLVKGKVELESDGGYTVCREGDILNSNQTTLLKMFGIQIAEFGVDLRAWWAKDTEEVVAIGDDGQEKVLSPEEEEEEVNNGTMNTDLADEIEEDDEVG